MTPAQQKEKDRLEDLSIEQYFLDHFKITIKNKSLETVKNEIEQVLANIRLSDQPTYAAHSRGHKNARSKYARTRILYYSAFREEEEYLEEIRSKKELEEKIERELEENRNKKIAEEQNDVSAEKIVISRGKVCLYEFEDTNTNMNSYAYFESENLVIDYWVLGNKYEDEYFMTIQKNQFEKLYSVLQINEKNRNEILKALAMKFKGQGCYKDIQNYLEINSIEFGVRVYHDEC
jgi:hypothetical protein